MRRSKLFTSGLWAGAVFATGLALFAPAFADAPDGLAFDAMNAAYIDDPVNDRRQLQVAFRLKNVTSQPITIESPGIFVGARWNSVTDANNRDFGHRLAGALVGPGEQIGLKAIRKDPEPGTWRVWPAYRVDGHWGPFRWHEQVIEVPTRP